MKNKLFKSDRLYRLWIEQIPKICFGPPMSAPPPHQMYFYSKSGRYGLVRFTSQKNEDEYGDVCFAIFTKTCDAEEKDRNGTLTEADLDEIEKLMERKEEIEDGLVEC